MTANINTHWLSSIRDKVNVSEALFETISDREQLDVALENISSDLGSVRIEVLQFMSSFAKYEQLEKERQQLTKKLNNNWGKEDVQAYSQQLQQKTEEQIAFVKQVLLSAHSFTQVKHSDQLEKVAESFFLGDLNAADNCLRPEQLSAEQKKQLQRIQLQQELEKAYDKLEDNANEFRVKAQLSLLNYEETDPQARLDKSIYYYDQGQLSARKTKRKVFIADFLFNHARYLHANKRERKALKIYKETLPLFEALTWEDPIVNYENVASTHVNIANLHHELDEFDEAEENYRNAIYYNRVLADIQEDGNKHAIALNLNNYANLLLNRSNYDKAKELYHIAFDLWHELINEEGISEEVFDHVPYLCMAADNLAKVYWAKNDFKEAGLCYVFALKLRKKQAVSGKEEQLSDLATTFNNIGGFYFELRQFDQSIAHLESAIDLWRQLADKKPHVYAPSLFSSLLEIGKVQQALFLSNEAERSFTEALEIIREETKHKPIFYRGKLALILRELGDFHYDRNDLTTADNYYREAMQLHEEMATAVPDVYSIVWTNSLLDHAVLLSTRNEIETAISTFEKAISIRKAAAEKTPEVHQTLLVDAWMQYADFLSTHNQPEKAIPLYKESLKVYRTLAQKEPDAFNDMLSKVLNDIATVYAELGDHTNTEKHYKEAVQMYERLVEENAQAYSPDLADSLFNLGCYYWEIHENELAEPYLSRAFQIYGAFEKQQSEQFADELTSTANAYANVLLDLGKSEEAEATFANALPKMRELAKKTPELYQQDLSKFLEDYSAVFEEKKAYAAAKKCYDEAYQLIKELADKNPMKYLPELAGSCINSAYHYATYQDDKERAIALLKEALQHLNQIGNIPKVEQHWSVLRENLELMGIDPEAFIEANN